VTSSILSALRSRNTKRQPTTEATQAAKRARKAARAAKRAARAVKRARKEEAAAAAAKSAAWVAKAIAEEAAAAAEAVEAAEAAANWAVDLPSEVWGLVAAHRGVVGACQLMRVCKDAHAGGKEYLRTLPGLVVCGGHAGWVGSERRAGSDLGVSDVLRLDLATMRWVPMPALVAGRSEHACCAVRGTLVVLGGITQEGGRTSSVEMLSSSEEGGAFVELPPLSCGAIYDAAAIAVDESDSAAGQVLLLGGSGDDYRPVSTVQLVDLATGECAPQSNLLHRRAYAAAGRLPDGRIVCAGGIGVGSSAEVWGPPDQGAADAAWSWRALPAMSTARYGCGGCVLSDGRFAVLGGRSNGNHPTSCEALAFDDGDAHWEPLPPMHDARDHFACGAVAGCPIVAGGYGLQSAELYDAELNRWLRLPCDLPYDDGLMSMGSAVL
jgi:hypothetical protein